MDQVLKNIGTVQLRKIARLFICLVVVLQNMLYFLYCAVENALIRLAVSEQRDG
jgi:hypothetical protein